MPSQVSVFDGPRRLVVSSQSMRTLAGHVVPTNAPSLSSSEQSSGPPADSLTHRPGRSPDAPTQR